MRSIPARMNVVRKEDKEARLKDFILKDILARRASQPAAFDAPYRLIALSTASPVVRALASLADTMAEAGIVVEAVLTRFDLPVRDEGGAMFDRIARYRHAVDVRLLDAHEQLVLGAETVWVGDCMRRDPTKRDAYECYSEGCSITAAFACRSFERIWAAGLPVRSTNSVRPLRTPAEMGLLDPLLAAIGEPGPVSAATRH